MIERNRNGFFIIEIPKKYFLYYNSIIVNNEIKK